MKSYCVYILYSERLDLYYVGHTGDIQTRLHYHNKGFAKFTKQGRPWKVVWFTLKSTKSEAYRLEMKLKNLNRVRLRRFMQKYT